MLLLSIPSVQTFLGRYATNQINATYGTAINVEKVGIQFNGDIEFKNILIKDHHNDTLIAAAELNSSLLDFAKIKANPLLPYYQSLFPNLTTPPMQSPSKKRAQIVSSS